jgi:type VI secretion system secreted protein VgrG
MGDLPGNRYISGIKSREIQGGRTNQLQLDDTTGEISAQLASEHGGSQLNLGYLTQPRANGRGEPRGEGAELRSEMAVAVRGAEGVLISASTGGGTAGKQLERSELIRIVGGLQKLAEQLSKLAERYAEEAPHGPELVQLAEKISELHEGGMQLVAIDGPMGVTVTSGQNLLLGSVTDVDIASGGDTCISTAGSGAFRAALSLGIFANQGDVKLTAASGKVQVQAQNNAMMLLAKKVLEIMSTTDWINITAKQGVRINGGGTELVLSADGIKGYTSGKHEMHASDHQTMGASSKAAKFPGSKVCPTQTAGAAQSGGAAVPFAD